ncbi:YgiW/YdeI family stress tolerance OB fold protein [Uliginosibacterium sp. H1]|uniref:YgiW/YdeI family stress tolerance OB fold protein n=1 Tax=Uliginosibacterium sp. H1 TaxID=3114757 RepID=UPI002E186339|nr:NirD/YgiW/YdeI family stress tolerance protein [Uliginosibacterium sp. H1]
MPSIKPLIAAVLVSTATLAAAQPGGFTGPAASAPAAATRGGFVGPAAAATTVAQAQKLADDTWVVLHGRITQSLGKERYEFRDATGSITLKIDDKRWSGLTVTPQDELRIEGEVDKDWREFEIDVRTIQKTAG